MATRLTIGAKLMAAFGTALILTVLLGTFNWITIGNLGQGLHRLTSIEARKVGLAGTIESAANAMIAAQRGILFRTTLNEAAAVKEYEQDFEHAAQSLQDSIASLEPLLETERGRAVTSGLRASSSAWRSGYQEMAGLLAAGNIVGAMKCNDDKVRPVSVAVQKAARELAGLQDRIMAGNSEQAASRVAQSRMFIGVFILLSIITAVAIYFVIRQTNNALRSAAAEMSSSAGQVASASGQIAVSSQALAQGAAEQASSLEETSASAEEIMAMTRQNAQSALNASEQATLTSRKFVDSSKVLTEMEQAMGEIRESSQKIEKIIKVIDEIAFQTNILSLNAAVEAARAGEAGLGFAVVADEVRNLAHRSAEAAKNTAELIADAIRKSHEGVGKVSLVVESVQSVTEDTERMKILVDEIRAASGEQTRGMEQIAKAISQMQEVTQRNAAGAEESASASEEMAAQAAAMNTQVDRLLTMVGRSS